MKSQEEYYSKTAEKYDEWHLDEKDGHNLALHIMSSIIKYENIKTVLDVGSGTGRAVKYVQQNHRDVEITGVEPVDELRKQGYKKGISEKDLVYGDATDLDFEDGEFDMVCEFSVLHHVKKPRQAIKEMLRVSGKAIFISDVNTFGQGGVFKRAVKQISDILGIWDFLYYVKTGGKGYSFSEGDGISYTYSVFDDIDFIRDECSSVYMMNTKNCKDSLYRSAESIALIGIK